MEAYHKTIEGRKLEMTFDNTMLMKFGNFLLNHVYHQLEDGTEVAIYDDNPLLQDLQNLGFPQYTRIDNPEWAENRAAKAMFHGIDYSP